MMAKFQQTLRNARFIGEMAFKGLEREIRSRFVRPQGEHHRQHMEPNAVESAAVEVAEPFEGYGPSRRARSLSSRKSGLRRSVSLPRPMRLPPGVAEASCRR